MLASRFIPVLALALVLACPPTQGFAAADAKAPAEEAVHLPMAAPEGEATPHDVAPATGETHGEGGLPQLNIGTYPSQIFWLLVTFAVLYVAFSKKILPTIGGVVDARDHMIKGNLDAAEHMKLEAENVKASYEKNLEIARAAAIKAVQDVEAAAKQRAADQIDAFRHKADGEMKSAEERVNAQKDKAMGDMANVAAEVASVAAEKITGISTDMQKAKAIVDSIAAKKKAA